MNGLPARRGPDEWAMVLYLFSKSRVTFSWNLGVGRKGQRTKEAGRRKTEKVCLPSFFCSAQESQGGTGVGVGRKVILEHGAGRRGVSTEA